ncbi:MAG: hypothetical protein JJ863_34275 [Deltaproteobacteria bacterium]|nr:hypothetical protein [Deltaproteobacteria bacterium]
MTETSAWLESTWETFLARVLALLPTLAAIVVVLLLGWLGAIVMSAVTRWIVRRSRLEALGEEAGVARVLYALGARSGLARFLGRIVFFATILVALSAAAELAGFEAVAQLLSAAMAFLPRLVAALALIVAGVWLGQFVRRVLRTRETGLSAPQLVGEIAFYGIAAVAVTMAAEQAGIDTELVGSLMVVVVGGVVAALALAFALACRPTFANLVARRYCDRLFPVGSELEHDGLVGRIVGYSATAAILRIDATTTRSIPCTLLVEQPLIVRESQEPSKSSKA